MEVGKNYLSLLPTNLKSAALMLIEYSATHWREVPSACAACGSRNLKRKVRPNPRCRFAQYACNVCSFSFNVMTDSPFKGLRHPEKWADFIRCRISGRSLSDISDALCITIDSAARWDRAMLETMELRTPELLVWWLDHQRRIDTLMPAHISSAAARWIETVDQIGAGILEHCPVCGSNDLRFESRTVRYICRACKRGVCSVTGTPFLKLGSSHLWPRFAKELIAGSSDADIARRLDIVILTVRRWRRRFVEHAMTIAPELKSWIAWQRRCRLLQVQSRPKSAVKRQ